MKSSFFIGPREVGDGKPCFLIAEVAQNHDGSLGTAHAYIDAAASAGADAIKFQTHIASAESTRREPWRVAFSRQDATRYDYWRRMDFTESQWSGLKDHATERGLVFLSSPFSPEAVSLLDRIGVPAWKVASGEVGNLPLLSLMLRSRIPILISSGMSDLSQLDRAVRLVEESDIPLAVFQCTTMYPCPPEKVGLNLVNELRSRYGVPIGLSDHSGVVYAGLAAATLGVSLLELHVTFHRGLFGPDVASSVTIEEFAQLVRGVRFVERMMAAKMDKNVFAQEMAPMRAIFGKSVVLRFTRPSGHCLTPEDLAVKKPGDGIPAGDLERVLGRRLKKAKQADESVNWEDLE